MRAISVSSKSIAKAWALIEGWVAAALSEGMADQDSEEIRQHLLAGTMQLWLAWDENAGRAKGCCVSELFESVRGRVCNLVVVAGSSFKDWQPLIADIERWALTRGCKRLETSGRAGWERQLKRHGWVKIRTTVEKEISDGIEQADDEIEHRPLGTDAGGAAEHDPRDPAAV